jgi:serine/threonine protein kinase
MSVSPKRLEQLLERAYEAQDAGKVDEFLAELGTPEREAVGQLLDFSGDAHRYEGETDTGTASSRDTGPDSATPSRPESYPSYAAPDPMIGRQIDNYRIERRLGEGGMATVYLAVHLAEDREHVALKLLRQLDSDEQRQRVLKRFEQEQQLLATFDHPNIAAFLDSGETEDHRPYLVMEYVEGRPIDQYCNSKRLTVPDRLKLFQQVCRAVSYCHQRGVIHRDLSVNNILVTEDGTPKLLDFGIAKVKERIGSSTRIVTGDAHRLFTLDFASPEQLRGNEVITTISDVYSLGCLLYRFLVEK